MSTTTLCRGLQQSQASEPAAAVTLRLKLAPKPCPPKPDPINNGAFGGWSFIESSLTKEDEKQSTPYVHPLAKRSLSTLSNKSLDICTESLGSETGSDIGDETDLYSSSSSSSDSESRRSRFGQVVNKKAIRRSFPPPLTSISGSDYVQFTPRREGGRLVIKAVTIATTPTCFQAERGNGCLKLRLKNDCNSCSSSEEDTDDEEEKERQDQDMAIVKYQRPCSWYKDNKRMLNWESVFGVAI